MKKKLCLLAALATVLLVGCKKEQSELDFSKIENTAIVSGYVTYSLGQDTLSNDYVADVIVPATGKTIYIDVPKSAYSAGATGTKIFSAVVDTTGYFSIEVPVKSDGISGATLRYEEFTAERATYLKMENGKPVFEVRMYKFETPAALTSLPTLLPGANKIGEEKDLRYEYTVIDMKDYAETAVLSGSLLLPVETAFYTGAYKDAADCKVEVSIIDGEDAEEGNMTVFTYGTTTNSKGEFSINLPIKNQRKGFQVKDFVVVPMGETAFTHYINITGKTMKLDGAYKLRENIVLSNVTEVTDGIECAVGELALVFKPGYVNGIVSETVPPEWTENLAGWVFGESEFKNLQGTAVLKGSVALAKEDAFGVGSYDKSQQRITITGTAAPYNRNFVVLTNADGSFEFSIPVEQDDKNPGCSFSVELKQPSTIAYTHYASPTKSIILKEGQYNEYIVLKDAEAEWNDLGDYYYTFQPATAPSTFVNTPLAGWVKVYDNDQIYTETKTVTAKVYIAQETAYATGKYVGAYGHRLSIRVDYNTTVNGGPTGLSMIAPVAADGTVTFDVPVKSSTAEYTIAINGLVDTNVEDFQNYLSNGKVRMLTGKYNVYMTLEDATADWNNKYTQYYKFAPSSSTDTYHENLAGWFIKPGYDVTLTASGKAYFAVETAFGKGEYKAAAGEIVTVNVAELGENLQVPVAADGTFKVSIPAKFDTDEYTLSASTGAAEEIDDFIHYKAAGKKIALTGKYEAEPAVKAADAAWNDMGTYYFKFTNSGSSTSSTYTKNLDGWVVVPASFTNTDATITGYIKLAAETGFWTGTYEAYAAKRVELSYTVNGKNFKQVVLTDQDGAFTCKAYRQFSDDAPSVSVTPLDIKDIKDFKHYYHVTSPAVMNVEGNYSLNIIDKAATAAWNVTGTHYYTFTPNSYVEDWSNRLVGWYVISQKKATANFRLYAQKAYLTADANNHEAKWTNAGNVKATVKVGGQNFDMPVSGRNLSFSMPMGYEIEVGTTTVNVSITLANETNNNTKFTYYPESTEAASTVILGNYKNVGNISYRAVTAESGNKFELKESAKMNFVPSTTPTGWSAYSWNYSDEI